MRKPTTLLLVLAAGLSCSKDNPTEPPIPPTITVIPDSATVNLFDHLQLRAVIVDSKGDTLTDVPGWTSASPNVVFVSTAGRVQGLNRGTVTITASDGDATGTARIKVKITVTSIVLAAHPTTLQVGDTTTLHILQMLTGDGLPPDDSVIAWRSSDTTKATVTQTGFVTARAQGPVTISAQIDSAVGSAQFTIPAPTPHVASVTFTPPTDTTMLVGDYGVFAAIARDSQGDTLGQAQEFCIPLCHVTYPVTLTLTDTNVVKLVSCCTVQGITAGTDTLVAISDGIRATALLRVAFLGLSDVSVGAFACGVAADSLPHCWQGGFPVREPAPENVHFASVSVGSQLCALTASGSPYCINNIGTDSAVLKDPVHTYTTLSVGNGGLVCGLDGSQAGWCWGAGLAGELGNGDSVDSPTPVAVVGGHQFTVISSGYDHACGVTTTGVAYCWGSNGGGMLGNGDTSVHISPVPLAVAGGITFQRITAGFGYTCGVATSGDGYCWGANADGELGTGDSASSSVPHLVSGGLAFKDISAGWLHTCGITTTGAAYCWGGDGLLGTGNSAISAVPAAVTGGLTFTSISVAAAVIRYATCGMTTGGVYCWGNDVSGANLAQTFSPVKVLGQP
ncbi:MAG TPA: Ig-like domain-containing protein [Gemmatimonadales bacterium]|nr:Ig-like domain-containing protein [Gemmatimonadales bacterium]